MARVWKYFYGIVAVLATWLLPWSATLAQPPASKSEPTVIQVKRLEVVDSAGDVGAVLEIVEGGARLILASKNGKRKVVLAALDNATGLALTDPNGYRVSLISEDADSYLVINDQEGRNRIKVNLEESGSFVSIFDTAGTPRVNLLNLVKDDEVRIEVGDAKGNLVWSAPPTSDPLKANSKPDWRLPKVEDRRSLSSDVYYGSFDDHWISEVSSSGRFITLEDDSLWEISPGSRVFTSIWLPTSDIVIRPAATLTGSYTYVLINKDDEEQAYARYLGH